MPEKRHYLILENKFQGAIKKQEPIKLRQKRDFRFSITGTLTPAFGTREAILWFLKIQEVYPDAILEVVGHCPLESFRIKLQEVGSKNPKIFLRMDQKPIAHVEIIDCISRSDFSLLPYQNHPAISGKMPTKLYECAALGVPVLISPNPIWKQFLADFNGGYEIEFWDASSAVAQFEQALEQIFFTSTPPESILWKTEKPDFQKAIQNLLS
jgi:hypothetical protein